MLSIAIETIIGIWLVNELLGFFFDIDLVGSIVKTVKKLAK